MADLSTKQQIGNQNAENDLNTQLQIGDQIISIFLDIMKERKNTVIEGVELNNSLSLKTIKVLITQLPLCQWVIKRLKTDLQDLITTELMGNQKKDEELFEI